jgi:DNA polymerase-1
MMGDAADNIRIACVGEVTAKKFLKEYGSMENLLANDKLKGKMKENKPTKKRHLI